mgnify:CR=1 FL=1
MPSSEVLLQSEWPKRKQVSLGFTMEDKIRRCGNLNPVIGFEPAAALFRCPTGARRTPPMAEARGGGPPTL